MGKIEKISIFSTTMITPDNRDIIVPNGQIYSGTITNYSANETRRVDLVFGIGYGDDMRKAKEIMEDIVAKHELILDDPAPGVAVAELADSSVNFNVRPWVNAADYWTVRADVIEQVKMAFDENGISIPFPQMDVHLDKVGE
jgi:small conductance mechanosensitive channel